MSIRLAVEKLGVSYRDGRETEVLKDVSFDLRAGERLAIIGESGSGKSTLALAIAGLLPAGSRVDGNIRWPELGRQPANGRDIGFVFQDPSSSLNPVLTIGEQIAEVARAHLGMSWREAYAYAEMLLGRVRLHDPSSALKAFPHQLSGGQRQRVAIAEAIAARPGLLIADEATSALDTIVQAEIVRLIEELVAEDGMSLMFISHDIALASQIADRIAVFRHGRLIEIGEVVQIVEAPREAYTKSLLAVHMGLDTPSLLAPEAVA
ncbi:peptide/nickel transport system ATP-binding protein [Mesorhizobium soli]|uniref:ABC transporter ATP-binding protein n=1 Tax=Pseudaminobacter soli (ex Li et al. 2025) TaxID=1295366 RepID=UPI002472FFA6|nr:ABC transporter ATP-binding protein [Mesorhizobium soli]MDH6231358.1 peptide/nickel transport system ATP-binding protein [Mesorhizobium soli]